MTPAPHTTSEPTLEIVLRALTHPTRRYVLAMVGERDSLSRVAFEPADGMDDAARKRFHLELHHRHLPVLDDAGLITWDHETDTVTRGPHYHEIRPLLAALLETPHDALAAGPQYSII